MPYRPITSVTSFASEDARSGWSQVHRIDALVGAPARQSRAAAEAAAGQTGPGLPMTIAATQPPDGGAGIRPDTLKQWSTDTINDPPGDGATAAA